MTNDTNPPAELEPDTNQAIAARLLERAGDRLADGDYGLAEQMGLLALGHAALAIADGIAQVAGLIAPKEPDGCPATGEPHLRQIVPAIVGTRTIRQVVCPDCGKELGTL